MAIHIVKVKAHERNYPKGSKKRGSSVVVSRKEMGGRVLTKKEYADAKSYGIRLEKLFASEKYRNRR